MKKQPQLPCYELPLTTSVLIPPERLYLGATSHSNIHWLSVFVSWGRATWGQQQQKQQPDQASRRIPVKGLAAETGLYWTAVLSGSDSRRCGCCISVWYAVCFTCVCTVTLPYITLKRASTLDLHLRMWTAQENLCQSMSASEWQKNISAFLTSVMLPHYLLLNSRAPRN